MGQVCPQSVAERSADGLIPRRPAAESDRVQEINTAIIDLHGSTETWGHTIIGEGGPYNILTGQRFQVQRNSLADAFATAGVSRCDYLKVNIEGAEHAMFRSCDLTTFNRIERMVGEVHFDLASSDPAGLAGAPACGWT